jgi:hypothetical protein
MREQIYGHGNPRGYEHEYLTRYIRHNEEKRQYLAGREGKDLVVITLHEGEGWEVPCPLLDQEIVNLEFPHCNRAGDRDKKVWLKREVEAALGRLRRGVNPLKRGSHADR